MNNAGGGRHLPILASALSLAALAVILAMLFVRIPDERRFEESLLSARFSLNEESELSLKRNLLRASRYASSSEQWKDLLGIAAEGMLENPAGRGDYRLFRTLAGRASASIPGDQDLLACWLWALLRTGKADKAAGYLENLSTGKWSSLKAEIRLVGAYDGEGDAVESFVSQLRSHDDPEFLEQAAMLTESAELTFDAALLWMIYGRPEKAYANAELLDAGGRAWSSPEIFVKKGVAEASAWIAYDSGRIQRAIEWLGLRVADARRRRVESWTMMQFLGDLHWKAYAIDGDEHHAEEAALAWLAAMDLLKESAADNGYPEGSWRLWINSSVEAEASGRHRDSKNLLDEALLLFPDVPEVKAAWAKAMADERPALARRLVRSAADSGDNPVLGAAAVIVDPGSVSPRLYEARMWELFDSVTHADGRIEEADARMIAAFVLDYMSSRKNLDSVDVAVDRYRRTNPNDSWVLSWRLAADAVRGIAILDLIPTRKDGASSYEEYRTFASENRSWRALHTSALYAYQASGAVAAGAGFFGAEAGNADAALLEASLAALLKSPIYSAYNDDSPAGDRIRTLFRNRSDLDDALKTLSAGGRKGGSARSTAAATLMAASIDLLRNSLEDIEAAIAIHGKDGGEELANLYYIEALALQRLGLTEEAMKSAEKAVDANPEHNGAREILHRGTP